MTPVAPVLLPFPAMKLTHVRRRSAYFLVPCATTVSRISSRAQPVQIQWISTDATDAADLHTRCSIPGCRIKRFPPFIKPSVNAPLTV